MSDTRRLSERNAAIQAMLTSAEGIKDFYRFTAQNPHITLHDACQIVIQRPKASVCHSFAEWNNKRRYINRGSKGIAYYDGNGNKCYVFDARDTHAEEAFTREGDPIGKVLQEMDVLNGTELFSEMHRDYAALCDGVAYWLHENGYLQDNAEENTLLAEGVSYSLWCGTDAAQEEDEIQLHGLPYDLQENANFCKNVYRLTAVLQREAAEAYVAALNMPKEVDDTDEETVSDEPEFSAVPWRMALATFISIRHSGRRKIKRVGIVPRRFVFSVKGRKSNDTERRAKTEEREIVCCVVGHLETGVCRRDGGYGNLAKTQPP